jgi:hypothetical protein
MLGKWGEGPAAMSAVFDEGNNRQRVQVCAAVVMAEYGRVEQGQASSMPQTL